VKWDAATDRARYERNRLMILRNRAETPRDQHTPFVDRGMLQRRRLYDEGRDQRQEFFH
jgi:hypothetical protein